MEKKTITKWLLQLDEKGDLIITEKEVSRFDPINRILDRVGYFSLDFINIDETRYLLVYEHEEELVKKTKLLISRIHDQIEKVVDMTHEDYDKVLQIAEKYMEYYRATS